MTKLELGSGADRSLRLLGELQHNQIEIPETGYNTFGKYKYPLLDDILEAIQPYLKEHSCIVLWSEDGHTHERYSDNNDNTYIFTDSVVTCRIQCTADVNDYVQTQSHGAGLNKNSDKTLKSETIGRRFSLMCLLGMQKLKAEDTDDSASDYRGQVSHNPSSSPHTTPEVQMSFKQRMQARSTSSKRSSSNKLV